MYQNGFLSCFISLLMMTNKSYWGEEAWYTIMATVDVTSLYNNIPHPYDLSALEHFLNQ